MFGTKLTFSRKENLRSVWERLEWNEGNFEQRSRAEFSHVYFSVLEKPKH